MAMSDIDAGGVVYQLRAVLEGVSPLVWRRLLVTADTSIADMHAIVQTVFGWDDDHLHRFTIHGRDYGISYVGGIGFRDDPHQVRLGDFELRQRERFSYEYDFCAGWRLQLRVEDIGDRNPTRRYPVCVGGRRAIPPESCNGAWTSKPNRTGTASSSST